jgi:hypothetical protein
LITRATLEVIATTLSVALAAAGKLCARLSRALHAEIAIKIVTSTPVA